MKIRLTSALADEIIGLTFGCVGLALSGAATAAVGLGFGAVVLKRLAERLKSDPDCREEMQRLQTRLQEEWAIKAWQRSAKDAKAFDACQAALRDALSACSIKPSDLAKIANSETPTAFETSVARFVVDQIAEDQAAFGGGIEREFALDLVGTGFRVALENDDFYRTLDKAFQIEQLRALGRIEHKVDIVIDELRQRNVSQKTERRAIRMLATIDTDDMTVDQIFVEILNRLEARERIDAQAHQASNSSSDFERLAQAVADALEADAEGTSAYDPIREALDRQAAERDKTLVLGVDTAIAKGDAETAAVFEMERLAALCATERFDAAYDKATGYYYQGVRQGVLLSLRIAVHIWRLLQNEFDQQSAPMDWGIAQNNLGLALTELGERGDLDALQQALRAYRVALKFYNRETSPMDWAMTQNNLSIAFRILGERGDGAASLEAVTASEAALEVYSRKASPADWAMTQNNLGSALSVLADEASLREAARAFKAALEVYTREQFPMEWAGTLSNLSTALQELGRRGDQDALWEAVEACRAALQVQSREASPMSWAMTQTNLGNALFSISALGDKTALIEALEAYRSAADVYTLEKSPMHWAMTQNNLGNALLTMGERGDEVALDEAVEAYRLALEVRTREASPMDWAATQNNLGTALQTLGERGDETALGEAVEAYRLALEVRTREASPMDWALTLENLADVYLFKAENGHPEAIYDAISNYEQALTVFDPELHPFNHRKASASLERALAVRDGFQTDT